MPSKIDVAHAIGLEPEQATEYLRAKGYRISWDWHDTWQEAHRKDFTVAKVTQMDVLQDIRGMVEKARAEGLSFETFRKDLTPLLQKKGWWGLNVVEHPEGGAAEVQQGSPERLKTIYRTNMGVAYQAGRYREQLENVEERPYWMYVAVMDIVTRPTHASINRFVFRYDDVFWKTHYPPCDWECRCKVRAITRAQLEKMGLKIYVGADHLEVEMVEIKKGVFRQVTRFKGYGGNMAPGPGWNYNPGEVDFAPDLAKYDPGIAKEYKKAEGKRGLAKQIPVKSYDDIGKILTVYDKENPGIFYRGFKRFEAGKTGNYFGQTDSNGVIWARNKSFDLNEGGKYNPALSLKNGMTKIGKGEDLSFKEEYSIKSLWHEILHNRAKGAEPLPRAAAVHRMHMETLNDWIARHTYPDFMLALGGAEAHGAEVLTSPWGYGNYIANFRSILKGAGISEADALDPLKEVSFNSKWIGIGKDIAAALATLYGEGGTQLKFEKILQLIKHHDLAAVEQKVRDILKGP